MKFLKFLLFPFSIIFAGITTFRNWLYDAAYLKSQDFPVPVINVGNLTVGGTGKTPHVAFLVQLLKDKKVAILSRGYKRKTSGFLLAQGFASAESLGDEPFQYFLEFPEITVAVCEDRVLGIKNILILKPETDVIILDDAFQHRPVKPKLNILISDCNRLFFRDWVLPTGYLRESRGGAKRADAVIISKCSDNLSESEKEEIKKGVLKYALPETPVFFTRYVYQEPIGFGKKTDFTRNIILVTGIAQVKPLIKYLDQNDFKIAKHFDFPDHYQYKQQDLLKISNFAELMPGFCILTTQKDWVKLNEPSFSDYIDLLPIFYMPIKVEFLVDKNSFKSLIENSLTK